MNYLNSNLKFKNLLLAALFVLPLNLYANGDSCEYAVTQKAPTNIQEALGSQSIPYRLAAAEMLYRYGKQSPENKTMQLNRRAETFLTALVAGKLSHSQMSELPDYSGYLANIMQNSSLASRHNLTPIELKTAAPNLLSDSLVPIVKYPTKGKPDSAIGRIIHKLNPLAYFKKTNPNLEKYGPIITFQHADQMAEFLDKHNDLDRLPILKYMMAPVSILTPLEVVRLLIEIPYESQVEAFEFLTSKVVGRFDFYSDNILLQMKDHLTTEVILKLIAHSGSNWSIESVLAMAKSMEKLKPVDFAEILKTSYSPSEIYKYLETQNTIEFKEAVLVLSLAFKNLTSNTEARQIYSEMVNKLYNAQDKKKLESVFKQIQSGDYVFAEQAIESDIEIEELRQLKLGLNEPNENLRNIKTAKVLHYIEARLEAGNFKSAHEFVDLLDPVYKTSALSYTVKLDSLMSLHIDKFIALKPTVEEFQTVVSRLERLDTVMTLIKAQIKSKNIMTASDFIGFLAPAFYNGTYRDYILALSYQWNANARQFVELNPTNEEFETAKGQTHTITDTIALMDARLKYGRLVSIEDIEATFTPGRHIPSEDLVKAIKGLKESSEKANLDLLKTKNQENEKQNNKNAEINSKSDVSDTEFNQLKFELARPFDGDYPTAKVKRVVQLMKERITSNKITTAAQFAETLETGIFGNYSRAYTDAVEKLWKSHVMDFLELQPAHTEFIELIFKLRANGRLDAAVDLVKAKLRSGAIKSASEYIEVIESLGSGDDFAGHCRLIYWSGNINFIDLKPTNEEFRKAISANQTNENILNLIETRLRYGHLETQYDVEETIRLPANAPSWLIRKVDELVDELRAARSQQKP